MKVEGNSIANIMKMWCVNCETPSIFKCKYIGCSSQCKNLFIAMKNEMKINKMKSGIDRDSQPTTTISR